ncbi:MAG: hypothetical protein ACE5FL_13635 [Myxococcota bacterium]
MIEALAVLFVVGFAAAGGLLLPLLSPEWLFRAGWALTFAGLVTGFPTGLWYHVVLRSCLRANDALPRRWWLRPTAHHGTLHDAQRRRVMRWFVAGGAGFTLTIAGCLAVGAGVLLEGFRAGVF